MCCILFLNSLRKSFGLERHRRSTADDEILHKEIPKSVGNLLKLINDVDLLQNHLELRSDAHLPRLRHKREAVDHIGSVIDEIQESLGQLEKTFLEQEVKQGNITASAHRRDGAKCYLENNGKVNCSNIIYEDENSWRKSRLQIDMMIKVLKNKIVNLKDIKKHLKDHRPHSIGDFDESAEDETSNAPEETLHNSRKPHLHHHRHHQQHYNLHQANSNAEIISRRRKLGNHSSEDSSQSGLGSSNARSDHNEIPGIDNQIDHLVPSVNASSNLLSSTVTPPINRRVNRTQSLNQRQKSQYDEIAAFRAEHQAMFSTTKLPKINTDSSTLGDVNLLNKTKPIRGKIVRKPTTTETTELDTSSTTVEPSTNVVGLSNELSSKFCSTKP